MEYHGTDHEKKGTLARGYTHRVEPEVDEDTRPPLPDIESVRLVREEPPDESNKASGGESLASHCETERGRDTPHAYDE